MIDMKAAILISNFKPVDFHFLIQSYARLKRLPRLSEVLVSSIMTAIEETCLEIVSEVAALETQSFSFETLCKHLNSADDVKTAIGLLLEAFVEILRNYCLIIESLSTPKDAMHLEDLRMNLVEYRQLFWEVQNTRVSSLSKF